MLRLTRLLSRSIRRTASTFKKVSDLSRTEIGAQWKNTRSPSAATLAAYVSKFAEFKDATSALDAARQATGIYSTPVTQLTVLLLECNRAGDLLELVEKGNVKMSIAELSKISEHCVATKDRANAERLLKWWCCTNDSFLVAFHPMKLLQLLCNSKDSSISLPFQVFTTFVDRNTATHTDAMNVLFLALHQKNLQVGQDVWQRSERFSSHLPLVACMISLYVNCGQLSAALVLEAKFPLLTTNLDVYPVEAITRANLELGKIDRMLDVLKQVGTPLVKASTVAFLVSHATRLGQVAAAKRLLEFAKANRWDIR